MSDNPCHPASLPSEQLRAECEVRFLRRSGPGGQHRNKVSTAVTLRHLPTDVKAEANERRSQAENQAVALFRLRVRLALQIRTVRSRDQTPSSLWRSRCRSGRLEVSPTHDDFPAILAEALDAVVAFNYDVKQASDLLGCSSSQLVRLLEEEPPALSLVNDARRRQGLHVLR